MDTQKIGFGGGCHWCTEGIFCSVKGVSRVEQGWISAIPPDDQFSEAVIVHYWPQQVQLQHLVRIHLSTHSAYSDHALRAKYRSAVYTFDQCQHLEVESLLEQESAKSDTPLVTRALTFGTFRPNKDRYLDYFYQDPQRPFCQTQIKPKLEKLVKQFPDDVKSICREIIDKGRE